nr:polyadenylate binding protein 1 [Hymenolepis microstoma]
MFTLESIYDIAAVIINVILALLIPSEYRVKAMSTGFTADECTLYIGDLHPLATEEMLNSLFSEFHAPICCQVVIDPETNKSRCHGFVLYETPEIAQAALETLNYRKVLGKPNFTEADLNSEFRTIGPVLSVKISRTVQGESKGYGYVQFVNEEDAEKCITTMNGRMLGDQAIFIEPYKLKKDRPSSSIGFTNLIVKNLRSSMNEERLKDAFKEFGEITSVCIMRDEVGNCRGFGFVAFKEHASAQLAVTAMNGKVFQGLILHVSEALTPAKRQLLDTEQMKTGSLSNPTAYKVLVENLSSNVTQDELKEAFADCQNMINCEIGISNGRPTGLAMLKFATFEDATNAVREKNGVLIGSHRILCALAYYRNEVPNSSERSNIRPPRFL